MLNLVRNLTCILVDTLCKKYHKALEGVEKTQGPLEELTQSLDCEKIQLWSQKADYASEQRGEALDIYMLRMDQGICFSTSLKAFILILIFFPAPTLAEIRLNLIEKNVSNSGKQTSVSWLVEGIMIEDAQYVYVIFCSCENKNL